MFSFLLILQFSLFQTKPWSSHFTRNIESSRAQFSKCYVNSILASHHQWNQCYGHCSRIQCTNDSYFSIIYWYLKTYKIWTSYDLDHILCKGDQICKSIGIGTPLALIKLPLETSLRCPLKVQMLLCESSIFSIQRYLFQA